MIAQLVIGGLFLAAVGVGMIPVCFALFGDEMPDWVEELGPLFAVLLLVLGSLSIAAAGILWIAG